MEKTTKRCRIWIPQWRVDDLEAWFNDMSAQGWALEKIKDNKAFFECNNSKCDRYYCHIYELCEDLYTAEQEKKQQQREDIAQHGWSHVTDYDGVGVFRVRGTSPAKYPVPPEVDAKRIILLYKTDSGRIRIPWICIFLFIITLYLLQKHLFSITAEDLLISPILHIIVYLVLYSFMKVPVQLLIRPYVIRKIKKRYRIAPPHQSPPIESPKTIIQRHLQLRVLKWGAAVLIAVLLILPIIPFSVQFLKFGSQPPIPNYDLPVLRLIDIRPEFDVAEANKLGTGFGYYRSYPGLLLPMYNKLYESDGISFLVCERYQTIAPWYADLLIQSAPYFPHIYVEIEQPEIYGFSKAWKNNMLWGYYILAIQDNTVYKLYYFPNPESSSVEEILMKIKEKAEE